MLQQDYLMRLVMEFVAAVRRVLDAPDRDPLSSAMALESAMARAVDLDADALFRLQPESFAGLLKVAGGDPEAMPYVANALILESRFLTQAGEPDAAQLRMRQARALFREFGMEGDLQAEDDPARIFLSR